MRRDMVEAFVNMKGVYLVKLDKQLDLKFASLNSHVYSVQQKINATAAAVFIIQNGIIVNEWYSGHHDQSSLSRRVDEQSQFNVGSIRKTYLALAVSILIDQGMIAGIDDEISVYIQGLDQEVVKGTTIRHLLTHTHGLNIVAGRLTRIFPAGSDWHYNNSGINLLTQLVYLTSGKNVAEMINQYVTVPYGLKETGWRTSRNEKLIYNVYENSHLLGPNTSDAGDQSNLFVSARELTFWGYIHLNKGYVSQNQVLPESAFERITSLQTPDSLSDYLPRQGFIWWLQHHSKKNEIGVKLPPGSFQTLGITGCACLVMPELNTVAVRMFNSLGNPEGYDYLDDIRNFGDRVVDCIERTSR